MRAAAAALRHGWRGAGGCRVPVDMLLPKMVAVVTGRFTAQKPMTIDLRQVHNKVEAEKQRQEQAEAAKGGGKKGD